MAAEVITSLENLNLSQPVVFCIVDLETTGLDPYKDEIIEIYILKYRQWGQLECFHSFVKCQGGVSERITKINGITQEKLDKEGREPAEVYAEVREFLVDTVLIAHNGKRFDFPFLEESFKKAGIEPPTSPQLDSMLLAKYLMPGLKSYALEALLEENNITYERRELHSARYDASCLAKLWKDWEQRLINTGLDPFLAEDLKNLNEHLEENF
ncbi:DNA polymerase III polC-type [Candidatus Mycoplasma haematolamae str. Purdue]|uniref:DNA polymerase III polC-type n=1 Tax=Mycoplasma haematolamae (strain Purdue) TaxID=1212765 RepID=I7BIY1_MYCHA|nr:3'-5' exonuclease [Candidatus Mycoplasma haematolamae]AFO51783.1 DNA polymerase III polC-type [Candidatus Mycoplasma haematolamae str. Purdue]